MWSRYGAGTGTLSNSEPEPCKLVSSATRFLTSKIKFFRLFQPAPAAKKAAPKDTKAQKAQQKATKNVTKAAPRVGGKR